MALILSSLTPFTASAASLSESVRGKLLLQVEDRGQAWYVDPETDERTFLYRPDNMFAIMRDRGVGITNADLNKIPVGLFYMSGTDSDGDHLSDAFEVAYGTNPALDDSDADGFTDEIEMTSGFNPIGDGKLGLDNAFAKLHKGRIFIQVESHGEAWWVNPEDNRRYFLGRPADGLELMRSLGLGISNKDLSSLPVAEKTITCFNDIPCFLAAVEVDQPVVLQYFVRQTVNDPANQYFLDAKLSFQKATTPDTYLANLNVEIGSIVITDEAKTTSEFLGLNASDITRLLAGYTNFTGMSEEEHISLRYPMSCVIPHKAMVIDFLKNNATEENTSDVDTALATAGQFDWANEIKCTKIDE